MFTKLFTRFYRWFAVLLAVAVMGSLLPQPVYAQASSWFEIISVKADESVTIRTHGFPENEKFTVRIDRSGNAGINGIVVAETDSGKGGEFEATYRIPAELKGVKTLTLRMEGDKGHINYNWFNNRSTQTSDETPAQTGTPSVKIVGVKEDDWVMLEAANFPAGSSIRVRVGPYDNFSKKAEVMATVRAESTAAFRFTVDLPEVVENVDWVSVRLDGDRGHYAYNAFRNRDMAVVSPTPAPTQPAPAARCEVTSTSPSRSNSMPTRFDFDGVWKIKNTSSQTWDASSVDYKYVSGAKIYKYNSAYDLPQSVKPGESITIVVDMLAPSQAGQYTTNWALVSGSTTLCNLPLTISVR